MPDVVIREVGLRDGLQSISLIMSTEDKVTWCRKAIDSGIRSIEIGSFVPPKLAPQMADVAALAALLRADQRAAYAAFVPNVQGTLRALEARIDRICFVVSASESHNLANMRKTIAQGLDEFAAIGRLAREAPYELQISAGIATAFGCTIEGTVRLDTVREIAVQLADLGASEIVLADTVGYADPRAIKLAFGMLAQDLGDVPLAAHFHDTRGLALANTLAALDTGIRRFDASLGGLGGCPHAPRASGNVTTEDTVFMLEAMGLRTGVDLAALLDLREWLSSKIASVSLTGSIYRAGLPKSSDGGGEDT